MTWTPLQGALCALVAALTLLPAAHAQEGKVTPPSLDTFQRATLPPNAAKGLPLGIERVDVVLQITIDTEGAVSALSITRGAGEPFDSAAMEAVRRFQFTPALVDGVPVAVSVPYTYVFELNRPPPPSPPPVGTATVRGELITRGTRAPVAGTMVALERQTPPAQVLETVSDGDGRFVFEDVAAGQWILRVPLEGDNEIERELDVPDGEEVDLERVYADASQISRNRTIVRDKGSQRAADKVQLSEGELKSVPGTFGDPTRVVATLPGVARSPFGLGYYVVRGANFENTGMLIDGFAAPLLYHFLGGPAVIHPEFVEQVDFFPGGYPVDFGRYTAGLVDVKTKNVPRDRWHLMIDVDLLKAGAFFSVPFDDGKGTIAIAGRRSYLELVLGIVLPDDDVSVSYWDYQLQLTYDFLPETRLSVFFMGSGDALESRAQETAASYEDDNTGDQVFGSMFHRVLIRFDHAFTDDLRIRSDSLFDYSPTEIMDGTEGFVIETTQLTFRERLTLTWDVAPWLQLRTGLDVDGFNVTADVVVPTRSALGTVPAPSFDPLILDTQFTEDQIGIGTFLAADFQPMSCLRILPGLRVDWFDYNGYRHVTVDPRLSVRWQALTWLTLKGGTGLYHQPPSLIAIDPEFGNPTIPPQSSIQSSAGAEFELEEYGWEFSVTGFYNHMLDMPRSTRAVVEGDDVLERLNLEANGLGRAYGVEFLARKQFGGWVHGWLTYTVSRSERRKEDGSWRAFNFDQTHVLNLAWSFQLPDNWTIGARYRLTSGNPTTPIVGATYDADADRYRPIREGEDRLPMFHQLDLRIDKRFVFDVWMLEVYLDIQNAYYAENAEFYRYNFDFSERTAVGAIPILPTLGLKAVF
ncbi:MAG: TonB-dependent receptor domain-containing protein [Myxococcota bacterium]